MTLIEGVVWSHGVCARACSTIMVRCECCHFPLWSPWLLVETL